MLDIHSGSTLLNLALSGGVQGGWRLGRVSNIVGDRSSGKTLLAIEAATLFAHHPPEGITPRIFYFETEAAFDQEYAQLLGMPVEAVHFQRIETVEDLYAALVDICASSKKSEGTFVVLDSLDAIASNMDLKRSFDKMDYERKAQKLSELFRKIVRSLEESRVHLMVISQVRENITSLPFAPKWRRSGGKALDFYCSHIVWLAECGRLKSSTTDQVYGIEVEAKVTKNKIAKPFRTIRFPLIFEYGVDNIESILRYLSNDKLPKEVRIMKSAGGFFHYRDQKLRLIDMIKFIESENGCYKDIVQRVQIAWEFFEEKTKQVRISKSALLQQ